MIHISLSVWFTYIRYSLKMSLTGPLEYENVCFLEWGYIYPLNNANGHTTTDSTGDHNIGLSSNSWPINIMYW